MGEIDQRKKALRKGCISFSMASRLKAFSGIDHGGAMSKAREVTQDHAKTMVEGYRNTHFVFFREVQRFADEEAVIENVVVSEGGPLGESGGAARELNVNGVVELQLAGEFLKPRVVVIEAQDVRVVQHSRRGLVAQADHGSQVRELCGAKLTGRASVQFGCELSHHRKVFARLE